MVVALHWRELDGENPPRREPASTRSPTTKQCCRRGGALLPAGDDEAAAAGSAAVAASAAAAAASSTPSSARLRFIEWREPPTPAFARLPLFLFMPSAELRRTVATTLEPTDLMLSYQSISKGVLL